MACEATFIILQRQNTFIEPLLRMLSAGLYTTGFPSLHKLLRKKNSLTNKQTKAKNTSSHLTSFTHLVGWSEIKRSAVEVAVSSPVPQRHVLRVDERSGQCPGFICSTIISVKLDGGIPPGCLMDASKATFIPHQSCKVVLPHLRKGLVRFKGHFQSSLEWPVVNGF